MIIDLNHCEDCGEELSQEEIIGLLSRCEICEYHYQAKIAYHMTGDPNPEYFLVEGGSIH